MSKKADLRAGLPFLEEKNEASFNRFILKNLLIINANFQ